jgi:hypothetical protein
VSSTHPRLRSSVGIACRYRVATGIVRPRSRTASQLSTAVKTSYKQRFCREKGHLPLYERKGAGLLRAEGIHRRDALARAPSPPRTAYARANVRNARSTRKREHPRGVGVPLLLREQWSVTRRVPTSP